MPAPPLVRILVIDDEPLIRLDARAILEDAGYDVVEALLAEPAKFEAILTDIDMPGSIDGLALARSVDGQMPEIAIVIMSGKQLPRRDELPLKAAFVAKPFSPSLLLQRVAEALVEV
jgi:CheY-like chemotaxis protein